MSADAADAAAERRLNHSIPRTYFVRGIQLYNCKIHMEWINLLKTKEINIIIIYLYKIAILHHWMQSFHNNRLLHACLLHARLLHGCDVTHISSIGRFATSISLREHANERYAECLGMNWCSKHLITRLLGRPQPQMYPPVALNQYTLVNRTHKHYIYICFKAPHTS